MVGLAALLFTIDSAQANNVIADGRIKQPIIATTADFSRHVAAISQVAVKRGVSAQGDRKIIPVSEQTHRPTPDPIKITDWIMAASASVSTIFAGVLAVLTWRLIIVERDQHQAAMNALQIANDEFIATHRPRLTLRRVSSIHVQEDGPFEVALEIMNIGDTPAQIFEIGFDVFPRSQSGGQSHFNALPVPLPQPQTVPPGAMALVNLIGKQRFSAREIDAINREVVDGCMLLIANYKDKNEKLRSVSAFRIYAPSKRRFLRPDKYDEFFEWDFEY